MPESNDDRSSESDQGESAFPAPSELQQIAAAHFSDGFPNPGRSNCPDGKAIDAIVRTHKMPSPALRAHLFSCSACFIAYRRALEDERSIRPLPQDPRRAWFRPVTFLAFVSALLLITVAGIEFWFSGHRSVSVPVAASRSMEPTPPPANSTPGSRAPETPTLSAGMRVSVDLDVYPTSRSTTPDSSVLNQILLPRASFQISLLLPEGRQPGLYTLRFLDDMERSLLVTHANSVDGRTLTLWLDTRKLPNSVKRISLERRDQAPLNYPATIAPEPK